MCVCGRARVHVCFMDDYSFQLNRLHFAVCACNCYLYFNLMPILLPPHAPDSLSALQPLFVGVAAAVFVDDDVCSSSILCSTLRML